MTVKTYLFIGHDLLGKLVCPLLSSLGDAPKLVRPACRIFLQLHSLRSQATYPPSINIRDSAAQ